MAEKKNFADIQRQDRNSLVKNIGIIAVVILLLIVGLFVWHYLTPEKQETTTSSNQQTAQLTMVPTTINYYDPQSEKTYDVGTSFIILSDGDNGYMKVSSDGTVSKVSSDGSYLGEVSSADRERMLQNALNITQKDNQANMALSGLQSALDAMNKPEEPVEIPSEVTPMSTLDMLYKTAEGMGYTKDQFIKAAYMAGGTPDDAAKLVEGGANAEGIIKAIMNAAPTTETETKSPSLAIEMQRVGIDEAPVTTSTDNNTTTEYPPWMEMSDPTAGMSAVLDTLAGAVSGGGTTTAWDDVNKQAQKSEWQNNQQTATITSTKLTRYDLVAGTTVPITIVTGVNTDLPGSIVGIVRQDVYDTLTGTNVLIPKGSRLLATYNNGVSFGQKSVQIAWTQLITPDGYQFSLPGFAGITPDGFSGVAGDYNGHFWQMLGGAMLGSLIDWGAAYATDQVGNMIGGGVLGDLVTALSSSAVNTTSTVGQQYAQMWANLQPTIKIKTGTETQLLVNSTISLRRN